MLKLYRKFELVRIANYICTSNFAKRIKSY